MKNPNKMKLSEKSMIRGVRQNFEWRNAQDPDFKIIFGLDPKKKWPAEGLPKREVQGFTMYVRSTEEARRLAPGQTSTHRVRVICPVCQKDLSAGRLHQHQH